MTKVFPLKSPTDSPTRACDNIAQLDSQLIQLLAQRIEAIRRGEHTMQSLAQTEASALAGETDPEAREQVGAWLRHATSIALAQSSRQGVAYLGPEYSYSHLATIKVFGDAYPMAAVATIPAVFDSILRGDAAAGVVPIENSTDGRVVDTLGMFVRVDVKICGEVLLPIHHNLLSRSPRESITEVHSKPQALSQCRGWLASHLPKAKLVEISSTAAAAELAANRPGVAAVASIEAGRQYGLDVIQAGIEDNPNNVTRFAILGRDLPPPTPPSLGTDKTAILFQVAHRPGSLADAMMIFKQAGLNLTWIESFPVPGTSAEYLFFVEVLGHVSDPAVANAIESLRAITMRLNLLGSYRKHAA